MARKREDILAEIVSLACDAGENGNVLLETGLVMVVRAAQYPLPIRSALATLGSMLLLLVDVCRANGGPAEMEG